MGKFAYKLLGSLLTVAGFMVAPTVAEAAQAVCPAYAMSARNITVSPYTISLADQCALLVVKASNATITVPAPGSQVDLSVGYTTWVVNNTLGNITIAGTVNGVVNPVIPQGASLNLYTDSANWYGVNTVSSIGAGTGDVVGPGSAVADNVASYNGGTGKAIKDSGIAVSSLVPGSRTITGAGLLAGGGDLTANRTITFGSINASSLFGNPTGAPAVPTVITLGTNLTFAGSVLNAAGGSASAVGPSGDIQTSLGGGIFGSFTPAANVTALLTTFNSGTLLTALTTKTGTGLAVFGTSPTITSPTLVTPALGVIASGDLTSATNVPMSAALGTLQVAHGGIGTGTASGTALDNISAFASTGFIQRTGAGAYSFATSSGVLDLIGNTRGSVLYRGVAGWSALVPGTNGQVLTTAGAGADPAWGTSGGGSPWNLTDTITPLTGITALTVDPTFQRVGGTAGAATLNPLCPQAATTLGDANGAISVGKIARISATLTAARSYSMPAIAQYAVGCQLTIVDANRTASASNTATITRNADAATLNLATTFPAISTAGFFTTWESDGTNWTLVGNGTVATLQAGQIYFGNASNQTVAGVPTGDVIPNSSNAWTIQASANVVKAPSNLTNNVLTKGDGTKNISASAITDSGAGVTFGSPTGGAQGANTLNTAGGIFINGVAVGTSGGNVTNSGTPLVNQMGLWVDATHIKGNVNLTDDGTTLTALQAFALSGTIAPTALSGTTSDYAPTGIATSSRIEIDPANGGNSLTGITTGFAGRRLTIYNSNAASGVLTISNNVTSSAGNRFFLPGSNDIALKPKGSRTFIWSTSANGWTLEGAALESIVAAGSCTNCNVTYGVDGRATTYANGTSGNVSNSGSPTVGQAALWVDATHIQGVTAPTMYMGFSLSPVASTTRFTSPFAANSLTGEIFTIMPRAGTIKSIAVADSADIGNANTITFTVRVNGVDSALVCILSGTGSGFNVNTCTGSVAYAANDRISVKLVTTTLTGTGQVSGNLEYLPS